MTQLSVPHFGGPPPATRWLRPAVWQSGEGLVVVLAAGPTSAFGRWTRLSPASGSACLVRAGRTGFSWRSAWLGAFAALGLVGGLAAVADATQPERPIRIALPDSQPATTLAVPRPRGRAMPPATSPGQSTARLQADERSAPRSDAPRAQLAVTPPTIAAQRAGAGSDEFYRAQTVQAATQRAILSGIAQAWSYGGLTGVVIAGPLDLRANRACHRIALWAESRPESGDSMAFTSCLNDRGEWRTPAGQPPEPPADSAALLELR